MDHWLEDLHDRVELHHVLGSVHPHLVEYQDLYFKGNMLDFQKTYFNHLALAAETGLFDTLSHPDLVKNVDPNEWDPELLKDHILSVLVLLLLFLFQILEDGNVLGRCIFQKIYLQN